MNSAKETQETLSRYFWHSLEPKTVSKKPVIFFIIWCIPPRWPQTQWNLQNIKFYNIWVTWAVPKKLKTCIYTFLALCRGENNFLMFAMFLRIRSALPTSRQTQWNFQNKKNYKFWVTWAVPKNLRKFHLDTFGIN